MNRRELIVCLFAAMPSLLSGQETKLVNCRTLEAAGNFVGSDEVLDGDKVCKKLKPGASESTQAEPLKPLPGAVISVSEPISVVEAAKTKKKATTAKGGVTAPEAAEKTVAAPVANGQPAVTVPALEAPEEHAPAAAPVAPTPPAAKPEVVLPVTKPPQSEVAVAPQPAHEAAPPVVPTAAAPPAATQTVPVEPARAPANVAALPTVRVHRDAPVAPGTPSSPPERDYGFSDANAVETRPTVAAPSSGAASEAAAGAPAAARPDGQRTVQLGAFDKPKEQATDSGSQTHNTNFLPGDTEGFQEGQRVECTKNITLGSLNGEKLVLGTPGWAEKWIGKNQKQLQNICFSATPMRGARNYLIVFYAVPGNGDEPGDTNATMPVPESVSAGGEGAFTTKYGSTWHYAVDRNVGVTVLTKDDADEPHSQSQIWYATAYTEDGSPVAERWPEQPKHAAHADMEHVSEELLSVMVEDLRRL